MRAGWLSLLLLAIGCGSDDSGGSTPTPPECLSDVKLSGAVTVDGSEEFDCSDGGGSLETADYVIVETRLPAGGSHVGLISVRMIGLTPMTPAGTTLAAGLALDVGVPPSEQYSADFGGGSGCMATIEGQAPQATDGELLLTANVTCSAQLTSVTTGAEPVTVERLRFKALY